MDQHILYKVNQCLLEVAKHITDCDNFPDFVWGSAANSDGEVVINALSAKQATVAYPNNSLE
jgi:hypothetical protein